MSEMKNDSRERVAIVILNWNGKEMMRRFLPSVIQYSKDEAVVWVADNASTDGSMEMLAREFPQVRTLVLDKNYGFAEGYNRALKQITADYYVLLNSDVEVTHHWLTPLIEYLDVHPDTAAIQPKLLSEKISMPLSMRVLPADISTVMAIPSVVAVSLTAWSVTMASMTILLR